MSPTAEKMIREIQVSAAEDPMAARVLVASRSIRTLNEWAVTSARDDGLSGRKTDIDDLPAPSSNISKLKGVNGFESIPAHDRAIVEAALKPAVGEVGVVPVVAKILAEKEEEITEKHLPIFKPSVFVASAIVEASEVMAGIPCDMRRELADTDEEEGRAVVERIVEERLDEKVKEIEEREQQKARKRNRGSSVIVAAQIDLDGRLIAA